MAFQIPESKKSIKQNRFEFELGGKTFEIPHLKFAPAGAMEHFEQERTMSGLMLVCDDDETREALRGLDGDQLSAFMDAWAKASGVDMGESQASSSS